MSLIYEKSNKKFLTPSCGENSAIVWDVAVNHYERRSRTSLISGIYEDEEDEDEAPKTSTSVNGDLFIMDCSRRVSLEFSLYSDSSKDAEKEAERKLEKLDLLISELSSFRDHLAIAYAEKIAKDKEVKE